MRRRGTLRLDGIRFMTAFVVLTALPAPHAARGQGFGFPGEALVTARMGHSLSVFHPGAVGRVAFTASIADGWHINSNKPLESYLIPSVLDISVPDGIEIVRILYPEPALAKLEISETKMSLYGGTVTFGAIVRFAEDIRPGSYRLTATLRYQGCNNLTCVEPSSASADDTLRVGTLEETVEQLDPDLFSAPPFAGEDETDARAQISSSGEVDIGAMIAERGLALTFIMIFFFGLALNLTPCIYPLIPITISYFGAQAGGRSSRVFFLAFLYVLGMSITYSLLGTVAAMTGGLFGSALQNPIVVLFIAAVLIALALSMFGLWEIRMPMFLARRTGTARQGYAGAVVMGLTMGIVAAPCIGPFVVGLLAYVGGTGNPLLGFFMFFTLAWGMGIPFLILGTLSGSIARLPRSGSWMIWVRKIFGFILVAMALYFARHLLNARAVSIGYAAIALAGGIYLGWIDRVIGAGTGFRVAKNAVGIAGIALAAAVLVLSAPHGDSGEKPAGIAWRPFSEEALAEAAREGTPVVIDFTAKWCVLCHELDLKTFVDPEVVLLTADVVPLKADFTKQGAAEAKIKKDYLIPGFPTIIFIDRTGNEMKNLRATGFIGPREFMRRLQELIGSKAEG